MTASITQRFHALRAPSPSADLSFRLEPGSIDDYRALAPFHYRSRFPGAVTGIVRAVIDEPSLLSRFLGTNATQTIGVLVVSLPSPACRLRDLATADRYRNLGPQAGTALLNREVRCLSRVIVDPRFRGTGVAVGMVQHALEHMRDKAPDVRFTEALAAMGRVSPFFERAGMRRYERPLREDESRLIDALGCVSLDPAALASIAIALGVIENQPRHRQAFIDLELRRWRRASARLPLAVVRSLTTRELLLSAREKLLLQPVYFIAAHHDTPQQGTAQPSTANHRDTETRRKHESERERAQEKRERQ